MTREQRMAALVDAATTLYLEHGKGHSVGELAEKLGRSTSWTRAAIDAELQTHGSLRVCNWVESKPTYSKSYTFMETDAVTYRVYAPSRDWLRTLLLAEMKINTTMEATR